MGRHTFKGARLPMNTMTDYEIGLVRLKEMHIHSDNFTRYETEVIGNYSRTGRRVELGRVKNDWWVHVGNGSRIEGFRLYYIIEGRNIWEKHIKLGRTDFEYRDRSPRFSKMKPGQLFNSFRPCKPSKKGRGAHSRINDKIKTDKKFYRI